MREPTGPQGSFDGAPPGAAPLNATPLNATVLGIEHKNPSLFVLRVRTDLPKPAHEAGQFVNLGLPPLRPDAAGQGGLVKRPYSIASAPSELDLEFYVRLVDGGALTPALAALHAGDRLWVDERCLGKFTLSHLPPLPPPSERDLVLVATGTGLAPYVAMLREFGERRARGSADALWRRCVVVEGVRLAEDLGYAAELSAWQQRFDWFRYLPLCSREAPPAEAGSVPWLVGRVGGALAPERFRALCGFDLDPRTCQVMLCGNPAMIDEVEADLLGRGFTRHRKKEPGQLHLERYW